MTDTDPIDAVGAADRVGEGVQCVADNAEHLAHALTDERLDDDVAHGSGHEGRVMKEGRSFDSFQAG